MNNIVLSIYNHNNDIFGLPQLYKGINFYPIKVKEVKSKELLYKLFCQPKNYIPKKDILKMSYLKFLLYIVQDWLKPNNPKVDLQKELINFLLAITHLEDVKNIELKYLEHPENEGIFDKISFHLFIGGIEFNEQEFDNIREIVLEQNGSSVEYIESYNPELEKKLAFVQKDQEYTFKDEIYGFCAITNLSEVDVGEKTLFQFKSRLEREMLTKDYDLFKPLEISGQISSKTNKEIFKHYLSHIPKFGRYHSILINANEFFEESGMKNPNSGVKFE